MLTKANTPLPSAHYLMRNNRKPLFFLLPYLIIGLIFFAYPLYKAVFLAFEQTHGVHTKTSVGLANFSTILTDAVFYRALINTTLFTFFSILIQIPLAFLLSISLQYSQLPLMRFARLCIFSPYLAGQVFTGIMFTLIFAPGIGLANQLMNIFAQWDLATNWLHNPKLVMPAILIASCWMNIGLCTIYFLAALQNVPRALQEAARIDGARTWQTYRHVIWPSVKPVGIYVLILTTTNAFQLFELPFILLQGTGPNHTGLTLVGYLYNHSFLNGNLGAGAAVGWILTIIIFVFSLAQIKITTGRHTL